jgi:acyl dehydratase
MLLQLGIFSASSMGSPGIDELRWPRPVRPGDTLHSELEVTEATPSRSKLDRGILKTTVRVVNQRGEDVMTFKGMQLIKRRPSP